MPSMRTYNRSFSGGQISPEMYGRIDDAKFQSGAATLRNFVATPTGAADNRAGFAYVNATKNNGVARIIPFTFDVNQTMVIELGDKYARFHTQGETLQYSAAATLAWIAPSGDLSFVYASPGVVVWTGHGLQTGDPVRFYVYGTTTPALPGGLKLGYTYTVRVLDADTFNILDPFSEGSFEQPYVTLTAPSGSGGGSPTNYPGSLFPTVQLTNLPGQMSSATSNPVGGLADVTVPGGVATLNATVEAGVYGSGAAGLTLFQYSTNGSIWNTFFSSTETVSKTVSVQIPLANLDTLQIRVSVRLFLGAPSGAVLSAQVSAWSVDVPASGPGPQSAPVRAYYEYAAADTVTYGGNAYYAVVGDTGGLTTPGTDASVWNQLPADMTYEIPTPYAAADLFGIHYVQSADVMTLVHPNYPPAELRRLGATQWSLTNIVFGPPLNAPVNVAVAASPGFLAKISTISTADPALITTQSNHTLAMGDGIYIANLTAVIGGKSTVLDGFYMVQSVPADSSGNLIPNELTVMDYSGNVLDSSGWSSYSATDSTKPITIQYGTKIFNITNNYAVTAIAADGVSTSALSDSASVLNNLNVPGAYNTVSWDAVDGAQSYNVFKQFNGLWGYIGNTQAQSFVDNNIASDMSITPGIPDAVFSGAGNYPGAVCYFQQRRGFAGTNNAPQNTWMTNSGTESMMSYSLPSQDTDRIAFRVAALQADRIQHMLPMLQLILLTSEAEFALLPVGSDVVTPTTLDVKPQSYIGASGVQPTIINTSMVYAAARGGHVRELGYAWTVNGYMTGDLSLRAADLFDNLTIVDQAYAKAPRPIVWFVSSNGRLLGLTYIPEEQIGAWHWHDTQGKFESICCVAEGTEDVLYAVINRTINGQTVRYVERMASRVIDPTDASTWFFVDAGVSQSFANPVSQISGLTWLEGQTVAVLADGGVQSEKTVTNGAITLDHAAKQVTVGLPYVMDLKTLPLVLQLDGFGQGTNKNINKVWLRVYRSSGIFVGPDSTHLTEYKQRTTEPWGSPPALLGASEDEDDDSELIGPIVTAPAWQEEGHLLIRQNSPLPLSVAAVVMEVAIGG